MYPSQEDSWSDLCVASRLAFRAVCNSAIDPSRRPVKKRVIERLSTSPEARDIYKRLWQSASSLQGSQPENFLSLLARDALWQTKVAEEVEEEHSWQDLLDIKSFKGRLRDWLSSLFEKLVGKEHPAARVLTAATLGVSLVVAVKAVAPSETLTIPVRVVASYDTNAAPIVFKLGGDSVKVNLAPVTDEIAKTQVPIQLQLIPDKTPVSLNFVSSGGPGGKPSDALTEVTKKMESNNTFLRHAASSLEAMAKQPVHLDLANLRTGLDGVSQNMSQTAAKLDDVNGRLAALKASYETQSREEMLTSKNEVQNIDRRLGILAQASTNQRGAMEMTMLENTRRTVLLPHFDPVSGQTSSKAVVIDVRDIRGEGQDRVVSIGQVPDAGSDPKAVDAASDPKAYPERGGFLLDAGRWKVTVLLIEKHWYGKNSVTLRLAPESVPFSELTRPEIAQK